MDDNEFYIIIACKLICAYFFSNSDFGGKIFPLKPIVKALPSLFDHSDKTVRDEVSKSMR